MSETLSACPFTPRCLEIERLVDRLRVDAKDTAIAFARQAVEVERLRVDAKDTAIALARQAVEIERLREALKPLAVLQVPKRPQGNAGAYGIRHADIERARVALEAKPG